VSDDEIQQPLHYAPQQGRWVCDHCFNTDQQHCLELDCNCMCREAVTKPKKLPRLGGLTAEQRRLQTNFGFSIAWLEPDFEVQATATQGGRALCPPCWHGAHTRCQGGRCACLCASKRNN
jgi:hypothetical protein